MKAKELNFIKSPNLSFDAYDSTQSPNCQIDSGMLLSCVL
ncbi:conserved hypothetical protein [Coxiella burnetii Q321]|nr:conserved hypothetical protein [Coxiella burnetii Q321]